MNNSSSVGSIVTVKVNPDTNGGVDTAPAIVTAVNDDGTRRVRVFASQPGAASDQFRDYVDDDGEAHDYEADQDAAEQPAETAPAPAPQSSPASAPSSGQQQQPSAL